MTIRNACLALGLLLAGAQASAQSITLVPAAPRVQQTVTLHIPHGDIGRVIATPQQPNWIYDPLRIGIAMRDNRITVTLTLVFSDFSAGVPSQRLELPLGQFPSGDYEVEVVAIDTNGALLGRIGSRSFVVAPRAGNEPAWNSTGLWWTPSESGWGLNVVQQGSALFATWFVYGPDGRPAWYVMSDARWVASRSAFVGAIHRTSGPWFGTCYNGDCPVPFDPALVDRTPVGEAQIAFDGTGSGNFLFTIDGRTVFKAIQRFMF